MDFLTPKIRGGKPVSHNRYKIMDVSQYVGMRIDEAQSKAQQAGFIVKVEHSGLQPLNNDHNAFRINFKVVNGNVVSAHIG
jgi:hypothetical protein